MFFKFIANAILSEKKTWAENKWATKTAQAVLQRVPRLVRHATKGRRRPQVHRMEKLNVQEVTSKET